jgi:cytochrome b involved in lipid metabolism
VVIDNVIYDLSNYKDIHPGGADMILQYAGKDATAPFREYGHSPFAIPQLSSLGVAVGKIKELAKFDKRYYTKTPLPIKDSDIADIEDFFAGKDEPMFC